MIKIMRKEDYAGLSRQAALFFLAQVLRKPDSVLGFSSGGTPVGTYEELVRLYKAGEVDFSRVTTFNLDEYFPIARHNLQSFSHFMQFNFFDSVNIPEININIPNGESPDCDTECADYEKKIAAAGGIDLQILGIGNNGHIAFNEPSDFFPAATHAVNLAESTINANSRFFPSADQVPKRAITMGIGTIMKAKKILLIASGEGKAEILRAAVHGKITPQVPASVLQLHPDVTVIADKGAGKHL